MAGRALYRTQGDFVPSNLFQFPIHPGIPDEPEPGLRARVIPIRESFSTPGCMRGLRSALLIEAVGGVLLYGAWQLWHLVR